MLPERFAAAALHVVTCLALVAGPMDPAAAAGQDAPRPWRAEGELGGAAFFGNTSAMTLTARTALALADSVRELSADGGYTYGQATDRDGDAFVNKRSWAVGLTFDHHPLERWSPFAFGRLESSLEQRIDLRYNLGAGGKYTLVNNPTSMVDLSLAMLGERTVPAGDVAEPATLLRWSGRLRARRTIAGERLTLASETFWKPRVDEIDEFTLISSSSVAFVLTDRISLKLSFLDSYDSEAKARGARSNNDGQVVLSVLSKL